MSLELNATLIEAELERILQSRCFRSRKSLRRLLSYVVRQLTLGKTDKLSQYQIAVEALGKCTDFDATIDPLVRIQVGRLRKQLDDYYSTEGRYNPLRITLPKGSYQLALMHSPQTTPIALVEAGVSSLSKGPSLMCIPRNFTQDEGGAWSFITQFARDYVSTLSRFSFCQVLFVDEQNQAMGSAKDSRGRSRADFVQLLDLCADETGFKLESSLVETQTKQVIWTRNFTLGATYPAANVCSLIFKQLAHETVAYDPGIIHSYWARQLLKSHAAIASHHQVLVAVRQFIWTASSASFEQSFRSCQQRLEAFPQDVIALFVYVNHCFTEYASKFNVIDNPKARIIHAANLMLQLAPDNPYTYLYYALACLFQEDYDSCQLALAQARTLNSLDSYLDVQLGLVYLALGNWELGASLIQSSINLSPSYPDWYHIPLCVCYFQQGHYLRAMQEAKKIKLKHFWTPMLRTALFHCNNKLRQGRQEYLKLVSDYPDFLQTSQQVMQHFPNSAHRVLQQLWSHLPALPKKS